ncbi:MAG: SDR family oxidoreductase [Infirmifilum sp.]|jgi:dTDP-4-dehydrorhamnose reductase|uniref:SDR family oxidoreductase n=1 Tax=Infirmifilum sp. TaxID=2856575 RepID=UPI003D1026F7
MILVTGASSSPGYKIALKLSERYDVLGVYNAHKIDSIDAIQYDLTKNPERLIRDYKPSTIVHAAAIGNVDLCEDNKELCFSSNVVATRRLLGEAAKIGSNIIYISTDYVFDGRRGLYGEEDTPSPINYYGLTKLLGEEVALSLDGTVIRIAAVYGVGAGRTNFGRFLVEKLSRNEDVDAATDQYLSPTLNTQIGEAVAKILEVDYRGIVHIAGPRLSRYDFATKLCKIFNFDRHHIKPVSIDSFKFKAPRPRDSSLNNSLGERLTGIKLSDIDNSLSTFKREFLQREA